MEEIHQIHCSPRENSRIMSLESNGSLDGLSESLRRADIEEALIGIINWITKLL